MQHRILVVDDDSMNREIIAELLADDYDLDFAESGLGAIKVAENFRPNLVLLDIMMPGIDGYETCIRLKKQHPSTKVILVSAKALATERVRGYESGADDYVTKPFDHLEFQAKVRVFLRLGFVEDIARTKSDLLALLAHETRTPLSHILASAELLETENLEESASRDLLGLIIGGAHRLSEIFEKSMTLFGIESEPEVDAPGPLELRELASTEARMAQDRQGVEFGLPGDEEFWVCGDEDTLRQAFQILCDFFAERRQGEATVTQVECVAVTIAARQFSAVRFFDDGEAEESKVDHLFELLSVENVDHHTSSDLSFDLPICAAIVRRHGGSVRARVRPEGGLICEVRLPQAAASDLRSKEEEAA